MVHVLEALGVAVAVAFWIGWKRRRGGERPSETPAPSAQKSLGEDAYRVGVATGLRGGSVEDAAVAQYALRAAEQKTGQKADAFALGVVLGMETPPPNGGAN